MDETEITNSEYRQFVAWVRDSMALTVLGKETKNSVDFGDISTKKSYQPIDFIIDDTDVTEESLISLQTCMKMVSLILMITIIIIF